MEVLEESKLRSVIDCSFDKVLQNTFTAKKSNFNSGVIHQLLDILSKLCKDD